MVRLKAVLMVRIRARVSVRVRQYNLAVTSNAPSALLIRLRLGITVVYMGWG